MSALDATCPGCGAEPMEDQHGPAWSWCGCSMATRAHQVQGMSSRELDRVPPLDYAMRAVVLALILSAGLAAFYAVVFLAAVLARGLEACPS